ncbi:hypothetical protein ACJZ2D_014395 [Fusarium nematophilum]
MSPSNKAKAKTTHARRTKPRSEDRTSAAARSHQAKPPPHASKVSKARRAKHSKMPQIIDGTLKVKGNKSYDTSFMVNAPTGTGDYVLLKNTTIEDNESRDASTMMNHPHSESTLEIVLKARPGSVKKDPQDGQQVGDNEDKDKDVEMQ